jgi:hypothetical protein
VGRRREHVRTGAGVESELRGHASCVDRLADGLGARDGAALVPLAVQQQLVRVRVRVRVRVGVGVGVRLRLKG